MKHLLFLVLIAFSFSCQAQSIFKPLSKPSFNQTFQGRYKLSLDSIVKSIRPVAVLSATVSDGAQLAGGAGIGYQVNKWDANSQSYITQYSISLVGLLGTTGIKLTGTGGFIVGIPGTNGLVGVGGGRDFTQSVWVLITGVQIKFN